MQTLRVIAPLLVLASLVTGLLQPAWLQLQQELAQREMWERLEKKNLEKVVVAKAGVQWIKNRRECLVNGLLFDVHRLEDRGTTLVLTGLYDTREEELKEQLRRTLPHSTGTALQSCLQFYRLLLAPVAEIPDNIVITQSILPTFPEICNRYCFSQPDPVTPPPRLHT
ncbi:MAG TPA: hypothetical protein PKE07_10965 [Lacibacter sp.]|nr:hypothetical protein [Lacibacter sp.]HMO88718.1 hypothetical protein [Lacibacter sp.]